MIVKPFIYVLLWCWLLSDSTVRAEEMPIVDHLDIITFDRQLKLSDLVNQTLEKYPDYALIIAMRQEGEALHKRGSRLISGALQVQTYYKDDFAGTDTGAYEFDGSVQIPVWNWGQREAGLQLAEQAKQNASKRAQAIKLNVAGLVRETLWLVKLEDLRYDMAKKELFLVEQLLKTVKRRTELGDLPKSDFLLAQSVALQKKIDLIQQEALVRHARKRYFFLTRLNKMPAQINEQKSSKVGISELHPALAAINTLVARKKAQVEWIKAQGSGKTTIAVGGVTERGRRGESVINSFAVSVNVPFGGSAFLAPKTAAANRAYVAAEAKKMHLYRTLEARFHEAEHALDVELVQAKMTRKMQANAQELLKMAKLNYSSGEINLTDFLKIQTQAYRAINNAQESGIRLQRNIAFYNQAVGDMP